MTFRAAGLTAVIGLCLIGGTGAAVGQPRPKAPQIDIKNAVVRVVVSPEARADVMAQAMAGDPRLKLKISRQGDKLIIDGGIKRDRIHGCDSSPGPDGRSRGSVRVGGLGEIPWDQIPQVTVRTPMAVKVGRSGAVDLANDGCGDWTLADVAGRLRISQAGAGASRAGRAGSAQLLVAGAGGVSMGDVGGDLSIDLADAGSVKASSVNGALKVKVAGPGGALIQSGQARSMTATVAGAGSVTFNGAAQSLKASIAGSGDIRVAKVTGNIEKQTIGSGKVITGR
jgi:hypothetical protein